MAHGGMPTRQFALVLMTTLLGAGLGLVGELASPIPPAAAAVTVPVSVGYADNLRPTPDLPVPWLGSPNVLFLGNGGPWDAGAIRLDNPTNAPIPVDSVVVDLQRPGPTFNLWGSFSIPAHGSAILTQTTSFNFDTSDYDVSPCGSVLPPSDPRIPMVTISIGGETSSFLDTGHILDTGGFDYVCIGNESLQWRPIGTTGIGNVGATLTLAPPSQSHAIGQPAPVVATVNDAAGGPLANVTVDFTVLSGPRAGTTGSAISDATGEANFTYTSPSVGTDTLQASVTNASGGSFSSNTVTVDWINPRSATMYVGDASGDFHDPVTLAADLKDPDAGLPLGGKTIDFTVGGQGCSATADAAGHASCGLELAQSPGSYSVIASFAGDATVAASSDTKPFTITREETTLVYTGPTTVANGSPVTMSALLSEDGAGPIAGRTVFFTLGTGPAAQSCTGTTDAAGAASCTVSSNQPLGPGTVSASFAGDTSYLPSSDSKPTLGFALLTGGAFVVGDKSASGQVMFWGSQWAKANSLTAGSAPNGFKGFENSTASTACGGTWLTDPGNSSGPPPAIPSHMAVIVASSIGKSGSTISGNVTHVVIVKTDPGYDANPGHPGTGTVVGSVC